MHEHHSVTRIVIYGVLLVLSLGLTQQGIESRRPALPAEGVVVSQISDGSEVRNNGAIKNSDDAYRITKVVDGDTVRVIRGGVEETVRLIGIDTPETVDPRKPVQCFGKEASIYTRALLDGKDVHLAFDATQDVRDKYGRLLAYVHLPDGTFINKRLIEDGYAHEYTYRAPYEFQSEFREAERVAQTEGRGLWADGACGEPNIPRYEATPHSNTVSTRACTKNTYNCVDFRTQAEAQAVFLECGGHVNDIHHLDVDKDGVVCESLK